MATGYIDPNGDAWPSEWGVAGGPPQDHHYQYVNKGTRQPGVPDTGRWLETGTDGDQETFHVSTIAEAVATTQADIWLYCSHGKGDQQIRVYVLWDGGQQDHYVGPELDYSWKQTQFTFDPALTQAQLVSLRIRYVSSIPTGGGAVKLASTYGFVTYETDGPPPTFIPRIMVY